MNDHSISYGNERIRFALRVLPARDPARIAIHVEPDGRVWVDTPSGATIEQVKAAVAKRASWISANVRAATARRTHLLPREYVSGESVLYLGRRYRLKVLPSDVTVPAAIMRGPYVEVHVSSRDSEAVRLALELWYRDRATVVLGQRLAAVAAHLPWVRELPPTSMRLMTRQWGSCSPSGRITLNPALVKAPRECIDYVMLHELCHLRHHNHSPKFYQLLDKHMPGWRGVKKRLDTLAEDLLLA